MAKLLHTADFHVGQNTHGHVDPESGVNTRLLEIRRTLGWISQLAREERVDEVIVAGDLAHKRILTGPEAAVLREFLEDREAVISILGNHDMETHPKRIPLLKSVDHYVAAAAEVVEGSVANFILLPYPNRGMIAAAGLSHDDVARGLSDILASLLAEVKNDRPNYVVGHFTTHGTRYNSQAQPVLGTSQDFVVKVGDLAMDGVEGIMLGHIHKRQEFSFGGVKAVYCGSPQAFTFGDDGTHGVYIWDTDTGEATFHQNPHDPVFLTIGSVEELADLGPDGDVDYLRYKGDPLYTNERETLTGEAERLGCTLVSVQETHEHVMRDGAHDVAEAESDFDVVRAFCGTAPGYEGKAERIIELVGQVSSDE